MGHITPTYDIFTIGSTCIYYTTILLHVAVIYAMATCKLLLLFVLHDVLCKSALQLFLR